MVHGMNKTHKLIKKIIEDAIRDMKCKKSYYSGRLRAAQEILNVFEEEFCQVKQKLQKHEIEEQIKQTYRNPCICSSSFGHYEDYKFVMCKRCEHLNKLYEELRKC
jgi:hypothetical protein